MEEQKQTAKRNYKDSVFVDLFSEVNTFPTQWDMSDEEIAGWEYHIIGKKILEKLRGTIAPNNGDLAANIAEYNKKHNGAKEIP